MRLASQIDPHGIAASMELRQDIYSVIMQHRPKAIIETGTYKGLGSTAAILHALLDANIQGFSFVSIEANTGFYEEATKNVDSGAYNGSVLLLNAVSLPRTLLPAKVYNNFPDEVITDHINPDKYLNEIPSDVRDDGLMTALHLVNFAPDLVLLDSAGHLGTLEFDYLMDFVERPFTLILDDTMHRKHYNTMKKVKSSSRFEVIKESREKFGHAIIEVKAK